MDASVLPVISRTFKVNSDYCGLLIDVVAVVQEVSHPETKREVVMVAVMVQQIVCHHHNLMVSSVMTFCRHYHSFM